MFKYLLNNKIYAVIAFLILLIFFWLGYSKFKNSFLKSKEIIPKIKINRGGYLVGDNIGYVPNVFSWGFNRHICYDEKSRIWWIFYYKSNNKNPPWIPTESYIVYKYSNDNGKHWSSETKLEKGNQAADFTIYCDSFYVSLAYGNVIGTTEYQSKIFWKKGEMQKDKIRWFVSSVAMQSDPQKAYTRVIPSIVYYNGYPAVSAHDQSQQGNKNGHQKVYVAISRDPDGNKWNNQTIIFDKKNGKQYDRIPFTSLALVKNKMIAIINSSEHNLSISDYLGNNNWSEAKYIVGLNYGGGVPEWSTVNDSEGNLHILYPELGSSKTVHGIYNGENWHFEIIGTEENSHRTLGIALGEQSNIYSFSGKNIIPRVFSGNKWMPFNPLIQSLYPPIDYVTVSEKMINKKLGIAWSDGDERDPNIWFICLEKKTDSDTDFGRCE